MTNIKRGAEALGALNRPEENDSFKFTSFKSGTTLVVKVLGAEDLVQFFSYGIFNKIDSFVAENPSVKSVNGYPTDNLTPWDKAWKFHKDKSKEFNDEHGKEAGKYRPKERYAMGFFDLTSGEPIIVDVSKNQAQAIHGVIARNGERLDRLAFELTKQGQSTSTTVSLTPVTFPEEDLTKEQLENMDKAPKEFDMTLFEGILYEADEEEMLKTLTQAGFDVTQIGFEVPTNTSDEDEEDSEEEEDEGHPF